MWDRPNIEFVQSQDLAWQPVPDGEFGAGGGLRKTLSTDPVAGATSSLVRFRCPQRGTLTAGADMYVLDGEGVVNGRAYGPGHYLSIPPGARLDVTPAGLPTTAFLGPFGPPALVDDGLSSNVGPLDVGHLDVDGIGWSAPDWHASGPSVPDGAVKWLRRDDRGIVFLSAKLPGWRSAREEVHPHVEESFRIAGDFWIGAAGVMTAGSYFFHRPGLWHGPLYSRTGTVALIRADASIRTEYRDPVEAPVPARSYLNLPHPALS